MSATKPQLKTVLAEDGELHNLAAAPDAQAHFCIHCGTANRAEASFCRTCGRSLDEQEVDEAEIARPGLVLKTKRDQAAGKARQLGTQQNSQIGAGDVVIELATLLVMAGLFYWTATTNLAGLSLFILIAWAAITTERHKRS